MAVWWCRSCLRIGAVSALALILAACGGMGRVDGPATVEDRGAVPRPAAGGDDEVQIAAYTPPAVPQVARAQPSRAVSLLMQRAAEQRASGDLDGALVSLERALRIAPEDPVLWHELAVVRLNQGQYGRAEQLAAKSNALAAAGDGQLRGANWRLIAKVRRVQGDATGARDAEHRAQQRY